MYSDYMQVKLNSIYRQVQIYKWTEFRF